MVSTRHWPSDFVSAAAMILAVGGSNLAVAQSVAQDVIAALTNNEGIFVDGKTFKIAKGSAKGDPTAQMAKMGAKELGPGAIIFRSGDRLYLIEGTPQPTLLAMKNFQDNWNVSYMKALKEFQDNWNISYMAPVPDNSTVPTPRDFQNNWAVSYMKALKDFQDNWNVST